MSSRLRLAACVALALASGCTPAPGPDFELPASYSYNTQRTTAEPCPALVAAANEHPFGSEQRATVAGVALQISALLSATKDVNFAASIYPDTTNPWELEGRDREFLDSGRLEAMCDKGYDVETVDEAIALINDRVRLDAAVTKMTRHLKPDGPPR